ncbi:phage tail tape measure protein [Oenococcus sp.]|uniref:phage tail tape measure protein n=1 Tax=Oenococcus sp. TaxID=1979414 RepID=UPI0039EC27FA
MAGTIKGITIEINGETTGLDKSLAGVNKSARNLQTELNKVKSDLKFNPTSFTLASQKSEILSKEVGSLRTKLDALKSAQSQVNKQFEEGKIGEDQYRAFNREIAETESKLGYYGAELESAQKATSGLAGATLKASDGVIGLKQKLDAAAASGKKIQSVGNSISSVGSKLSSTLTVGVGAAFVYAAKQAVTFDGQIQQVRALLNDGSTSQTTLSKQMVELGNASKKWSNQYGISTTNINNGIQEMVKRGYDFKQVMGAMPSILDATVGSGDDFNDVMTASASVLEQFGLRASSTSKMIKNTARVTDSLTYVANKTAAGFQDMATAMTYVGPTAHSAGISLEETAAAIGLLSNNGIEADKAGTGLRGALTKLLKPSDANAAAMAKMGISVEAFKKGTLTFPEILDKIKTNTAKWTKEEKASAIATAFGTNAQAAMNVLVDQGGSALTNLTKETQNATGYTKKLANQMNDTSANNIKKLVQSLNNLATTLGQDLVPVITPVVNNLTKMVEGFGKMSKPAQEATLKTLAFAAAAGPLLVVTGKLISSFGILKSALAGLGSRLVVSSAGAAAADTAVAGLGASAETAAVSATGLGLALTPLAIGIGVAASAVGLGALAWEVWGKKAYAASQSTSQYGADISKNAQNTFDSVQRGADNAKLDILKMGDAKPSTKNLENFKKAVDSIATAADKASKSKLLSFNSTKSTLNSILKAGGIDSDTSKLVKNWIDTHQKSLSSAYTKSKALISGYQSAMNSLYSDIASHGGKVTAQEQQDLSMYVDKISSIVINNISGLSKKTKATLEKVLSTDDYSKLSQGELETAAKNYESVVSKSLSSSAKSYSAIIKDMGLKGKQASAVWKNYFKENATEIQPLAKDFQAQLSKVATPQQAGQLLARVQSLADSLGVPMSKLWKQMGLGSEQLMEAISSVGSKWNDTTFRAKVLKVDGEQAYTIMNDMFYDGDAWNKMTLQDKNAIVNNKASKSVLAAMIDTKVWNELSVSQKQAVLQDLASGNVGKAMLNLAKWLGIKIPQKVIDAYDNTKPATKSAQNKINNVKQYGKPMLVAQDGTYNGVHTAQVRIDSLRGKTVNVSADTSGALAKVQNLKYILSHINATISVNAHVSASAANRSSAKISTSFYANGGVFTKPTLFSNNGQNSVVGEAGPEAALPLTHTVLAGIGAGIAANMPPAASPSVTVNIYPTNDMSDYGINNMATKIVNAVKSNLFLKKDLSNTVGSTLAKGVN